LEGSLNRRENGQRGPRERRKRELSLEEIGFLNTTNRKRNGGIKKKTRITKSQAVTQGSALLAFSNTL
jgi:hypothetical protein